MCLECGHVGCGRIQKVVEGNGHAQEHFKNYCKIAEVNSTTKEFHQHNNPHHAHAAYVSSIDESGIGQTFCYLCDSFIQNPFKKRIRNKDGKGKKLSESANATTKQEESCDSIYTGISNEGQTCYIASVMQLLSEAFRDDNDLSIHFSLCDCNPLDCFCCQFIKIMNEIKNNKKLKNKVEICDFTRIIYRDMPELVKNRQHDSTEFLQQTLDKLAIYEDCMLMPKVTDRFEFVTETKIACDSCQIQNITEDISKIQYLAFKDNIFLWS